MSRTQPAMLYTAEQSRHIDRSAIEDHGLPGARLMARAARAAFAGLTAGWPEAERVQVLCGPGNNGGDGLLVAALAKGRGLDVQLWLVDGEPRTADALQAMQTAQDAGLVIEAGAPDALDADAVIVDAMLGTGITGEVRPAYRRAIDAINASGAEVLALDVPSGIDSDTGSVLGAAVQAHRTISFITAKRGLYTGMGPGYAGVRSLDNLNVPDAAFDGAGPACQLLRFVDELQGLPRRHLHAHKGSFGRCLLVGGDHGMGGAVLLAAEAALRSGVGLAKVATRSAHIAPLLARLPECLSVAVSHRNDLQPLLADANAIVVGPGLGQEPWGEQMLHACLRSGKPLVLDADALNLLAGRDTGTLPENSVITPHPGEAARLLAQPIRDIQADRFDAAERLQKQLGATVILKGNGSVVCGNNDLSLCADGNPGMASAGMGDVLSGVIGALLAQGMSPAAAARLGCVLHASAGDAAAQRLGESALLASDVITDIARLLP